MFHRASMLSTFVRSSLPLHADVLPRHVVRAQADAVGSAGNLTPQVARIALPTFKVHGAIHHFWA